MNEHPDLAKIRLMLEVEKKFDFGDIQRKLMRQKMAILDGLVAAYGVGTPATLRLGEKLIGVEYGQ